MKRKTIHPRLRQKIFERDNFKCVNCGASGDFNCLEVDHIISIVDGGTNEESNLQTLCYKCNMKKRFGKETTNKFFLNLTPIQRLELVKERLEEYKELTYAEFKVVFTQDELFKRLRLDLLYLNDLFLDISGNKKDAGAYSNKLIKQRDKLIVYLYENKEKLDINQESIAEIVGFGRTSVAEVLRKSKERENEGI